MQFEEDEARPSDEDPEFTGGAVAEVEDDIVDDDLPIADDDLLGTDDDDDDEIETSEEIL